jgi:predicted CoA-substrate-specific enzyme activase
VILREDGQLVGKGITNTGFRLVEAAMRAYQQALAQAGLTESDVAYVVSTGYGRYQVPFRDVQVTDLTAHARGACFLFPNTRTVLDVGGQTMKASRLDERGKVRSFRLNDKCAAGTGAFLEKTARYLGYNIEEIGPLIATSKEVVPISGVCAVFAESEVINHLSSGCAPADIMHGAIVSLVDRSIQLMKRVRMEPEFTLVGGIMRFETMVRVVSERLKADVNVPPGDLVQYTGAIGAAVLAHRRLQKLRFVAPASSRPEASATTSFTGVNCRSGFQPRLGRAKMALLP